jgi:hypothetical protein
MKPPGGLVASWLTSKYQTADADSRHSSAGCNETLRGEFFVHSMPPTTGTNSDCRPVLSHQNSTEPAEIDSDAI